MRRGNLLWVALLAGFLAPVACGGDDGDKRGGDSSGGTSGGGDGSGGDDGTGGESDAGSGGDTGSGGTGGMSSTGGAPPTISPKKTAATTVPGGDVSRSTNFILIHTIGEGPGGNRRMKSTNYTTDLGVPGTR